jgi:hypothetical protein
MTGLIAGVNPCALTTVVFLLSMLVYLKTGRQQIMAVAVGFTAAMLATFFLLELGFFTVITTFCVSHGVSWVLACAVGFLAFLLSLWSAADAIGRCRSGDTTHATLGSPRVVRPPIGGLIRAGLTTRTLVGGSVALGSLVSMLDSLCTGQARLPVRLFIAPVPAMRTNAVAYLLLYTVMFMLPLIVVLLLVRVAATSDAFDTFLRRHLAFVKLGMAILFATLGVLAIATV